MDDSLLLIPMLVGLAGGLALFLHGMTMMSNAMRAMAGAQIKTIMARLAGNRLSALVTGAAITAVVQSSTVTSVIAIGFVSAGDRGQYGRGGRLGAHRADHRL